MLIIKNAHSRHAISYSSIESIYFNDNPENKDVVIMVTTKSGCRYSILNATDLMGESVDFNIIIKSWIDEYTAWTIKEGNSNSAPKFPQVNYPQ